MTAVDTLNETLWTAGLLCEVCEDAPWTQCGRWLPVLVCASCAAAEPDPVAADSEDA